jgi:hypothetical protein
VASVGEPGGIACEDGAVVWESFSFEWVVWESCRRTMRAACGLESSLWEVTRATEERWSARGRASRCQRSSVCYCAFCIGSSVHYSTVRYGYRLQLFC